MQPGTAWTGDQLSAGRLRSGFVRGNNPARRPKWNEEKEKRRLIKRRRMRLLPSGVAQCVRARLSVRRERQAANDRTTKRCFPSTTLATSSQRLLLHAAWLISRQSRGYAQRLPHRAVSALFPNSYTYEALFSTLFLSPLFSVRLLLITHLSQQVSTEA